MNTLPFTCHESLVSANGRHSVGASAAGLPPMLLLLIMMVMVCRMNTHAADHDSLSHIGFTTTVMPSRLIVMDQWQRLWQRNKQSTALAAEINYTPLPADSSAFARDYGYPTFSVGAKLSLNDVTMHRSPHSAWGMAEEVDYDSRLGNIMTLYATFSRPWLRHCRWTFDYMLGTGIGWGKHKYSKGNNIDNELTGSRFLIYFTAGAHATYRLAGPWGLKAGVEFYHHSNGALNRPNKGANIVGPVAGVVYAPAEIPQKPVPNSHRDYEKSLFFNLALGAGGKTLNEDWQITQFHTSPDSPRYRTNHFHFYMAYSLQADLMYRYARRWASGIGADIFYGTYSDRIREIEEENARASAGASAATSPSVPTLSPWSMGVALKHNAYYGNLSVRMSLGYYLYRHMGTNAQEIEKPYYERIGVHYAFPKLGGLSLGANVKAHLTKADLTEVVISLPLKIR